MRNWFTTHRVLFGKFSAGLCLLIGVGLFPQDLTAEGKAPASLVALEEAFVDAAATAERAVVTLEIHGSSTSLEGLPSGMERFFPMDGLGSGFIIDSKGTVITNHHVVHEAESIDVILNDGRQFKAKVVASDPSSDVGVLEIVEPPDDLPVVALGNSDELRVGQFALAIGSPLGYERSVTFGHISALHRSSIGERGPGLVAPGFEELTLQDFIQVDTPINPGNSGGPLVDIHGRVVGVNAAIMAAPGGGLGFSIPINLALRVARQLIAKGEVTRGWLGVRMSDNNPAQADAFDLPTSQGALVVEVFPGSPASDAKLLPDDLIVQVGSRVVRSSRDLVSAVATAELNEALPLTVFRKERGTHQRRRVQVVLTEQPEGMKAASRAGATSTQPETTERSRSRAEDERSVESRGGRDIDRAYLIRGLGIEMVPAAGTRRVGLEVADVAPRSYAEQAGLAQGDVILEVGGKTVVTLPQVRRELQGSERPFISVVVRRSGRKRYLSIEVPR